MPVCAAALIAVSACDTSDEQLLGPSFMMSGVCPQWFMDKFPDADCGAVDSDQRAKIRNALSETNWRWSDPKCDEIGSKFLPSGDDPDKWYVGVDSLQEHSSWTGHDKHSGTYEGTVFSSISIQLTGTAWRSHVGHEAAHGSGFGFDDEQRATAIGDYCAKLSSDRPWEFTL